MPEYICDFLNSDMSYNKIRDLEFIDDDHFLAAYDGGLYMMTAAAGARWRCAPSSASLESASRNSSRRRAVEINRANRDLPGSR